MTEEREKAIQKDLLWDYTEGEQKLEAFRVEFGKLADTHENIAKLLRDRPETIKIDIETVRAEAERLAGYAAEYRELLLKNSERRGSLIKMGVHLPPRRPGE